MSQTVIDVKVCPACSQEHSQIQTVEAVNPVRTAKGQQPDKPRPVPKRFFYCPTTGQQVSILPKLTIESPPEK